ncbi:MAG: hypothetical protein ACI4DQ_07180 [Lachnospiraceae bacterium]
MKHYQSEKFEDTYMISNANNWNIIDRAIYCIEAVVVRFTACFKQEKTPDPEEIILAATKHLQEENEELKDFRIPEKLTFNEKSATYTCPKCGMELSQELVEDYKIKHCIECGKRLFRLKTFYHR